MQTQMQQRLHCSGQPQLPSSALRTGRLVAARPFAPASVDARGPAASTSAKSSKDQEIYLGFEKEEGFGSREGRKGRTIKDDPSKYPDKEDLGWFRGATGGWAGGEAALKNGFLSGVKATKPKPQFSESDDPPKKLQGSDPIYVGFGKDDVELAKRKAGVKGRVILDDARRYPAKEDLGPLLGATGGFAGGEVGVQQFSTTGELKLRDPNEYGAKKQFSPVLVAFLVAVAAAGGGVALDLIFNAGESLVKADLLEAPIDDHTKTLLLAALALLGVAGVVATGKAAVESVGERVQDLVRNVILTSVFAVGVFLVARAVLEAP